MVDNTTLAATLAQTLAMEKTLVRFAWSRVRFNVVTRVAVRSATSLACLASKSAPGLVHIGAHESYHAQYLVTFFHALNVIRQSSVIVISVLPSVERYAPTSTTTTSAPVSRSRR